MNLWEHGHSLEYIGEEGQSFAPKLRGRLGVFGLVGEFELAVGGGEVGEEGCGSGSEEEEECEFEF